MLRPLVIAFVLAGLATSSALAQQVCTPFFDKQEFETFNENHGKFLKGVEDFEESNIDSGAKQALPAPLEGNVPNVAPNGVGFPDGLEQKNIIIQDNITQGCNPPGLNPSGSNVALYVIGPGFIGSNSEKVGEDLEVLKGQHTSLDLIFTPDDNHTGVGFELSFFEGFPATPWHITVYDKQDQVMGKFNVPPSVEPAKTFFGIWCEETIGRINVCDDPMVLTPDAIDNIQMWSELPVPVESRTWGQIKARYIGE